MLGYGPMLPLVLAAVGAWLGAEQLGALALRLAIIWAALVLTFIGGVRRGFGFGVDQASTVAEITGSTAYFGLAGLALIAPRADWALGVLILGYLLAAVLDRRAALAGNAPSHFARLRPPQLGIGIAALAALLAWLILGDRA